MNILLVGERYSGNLGDAVICETVSKILEDYNDEINIISLDISGRTDYGAYYNVIRDFARFKIKNYLGIPFKYADCLNIQYCIHNLSSRDLLRYSRVLVQLENILKKNKIDLTLFAGGQMFYDYFIDMMYCITKRLSKAGIKTLFYGCGWGG